MAFWGLVLEPKKSYTQTEVEQPFHISMAALDLQNCDPSDQSVSVVCRKRDSDFILCNLSKKHGVYNVPLNLDFELGGEINFHVLGNSAVHLTGYIIEDYNLDSDESMGEEEEDEEADNDGFKNTKKQLEAAMKRKQPNAPQNKSKKVKLEELAEEEEDEDDSDFDMDDSDDGEEEEVEEEEDEDDDDEDDEEEEETPVVPQKEQGKKDKKQAKNQQAANASPKTAASKPDQKQGKNQPKGQTPPQNKAANGTQPQANGKANKQVIQGVQVEDVQVGTGPVAKAGKSVSVYYVGRLKSNNKQFDATTTGKGFAFKLGRGEVIKGWDVGVQGMKVGGKRRLVIPPKMGYGDRGAGGAIPPNATLVFDVELKRVN